MSSFYLIALYKPHLRVHLPVHPEGLRRRQVNLGDREPPGRDSPGPVPLCGAREAQDKHSAVEADMKT